MRRGEPADVLAFIVAARKAGGDDVEKNARGCLVALREAALAQARLADAALEIFETCILLANEAALATIGPTDTRIGPSMESRSFSVTFRRFHSRKEFTRWTCARRPR